MAARSTIEQRIVETLRAADGPLTASEIATRIGISEATADLFMDRLRDEGLIRDKPSLRERTDFLLDRFRRSAA